MIVITKIEYLETDQDPMKLVHQRGSAVPVILNGEQPDRLATEQFIELIHGRRFRRPSDGLDVIIGVTDHVGDLIGMQAEAWDTLEAAMNSFRTTANILDGKLNKLRCIGLWARVKFMFTGRSPV